MFQVSFRSDISFLRYCAEMIASRTLKFENLTTETGKYRNPLVTEGESISIQYLMYILYVFKCSIK
jgi:hypothetical protein